MIEEKLKDLIAHFGGYLCHQCESGNHELCCGYNNLDACKCKIYIHNWEKAFEAAYTYGLDRLKSLRIR